MGGDATVGSGRGGEGGARSGRARERRVCRARGVAPPPVARGGSPGRGGRPPAGPLPLTGAPLAGGGARSWAKDPPRRSPLPRDALVSLRIVESVEEPAVRPPLSTEIS